MGPLQRFFIRALTHCDVLSATVLCRRPTLFLRHIHNLNVGIGIQYLYGCTDQTLAAINQTADLEAWKTERMAGGELSISDLYKGGMRILHQLLAMNRSWHDQSFSGAIADTFLFAAIIQVNVVMSGKVFFLS